jgi:hypothetical protein
MDRGEYPNAFRVTIVTFGASRCVSCYYSNVWSIWALPGVFRVTIVTFGAPECVSCYYSNVWSIWTLPGVFRVTIVTFGAFGRSQVCFVLL